MLSYTRDKQMQIISKQWTDENLKSTAKPVNAPLIKKYTRVENYRGRADQTQEVIEYVTEENYLDMCHRVRNLKVNDSVTGSSNFGKFIKLLRVMTVMGLRRLMIG